MSNNALNRVSGRQDIMRPFDELQREFDTLLSNFQLKYIAISFAGPALGMVEVLTCVITKKPELLLLVPATLGGGIEAFLIMRRGHIRQRDAILEEMEALIESINARGIN